MFFWAVLIPARTANWTPSMLLSLILIVPLAALSALLAWGVAATVQAIQDGGRGE